MACHGMAYYRIVQLEGTLKDLQVQLPDHLRANQKLLRPLSKWLSNTDRHGAATTSLGNLFQCLTTVTVNKFSLLFSLNFPWYSPVPFSSAHT